MTFQIKDTFDIRLIVTSKLQDVNGDEFGTTNVGFIPDPMSSNTTDRATCVEFRCPGLVHTGASDIKNLPTFVSARISTAKTDLSCTM